MSAASKHSIVLAERDVVIRIALGEYLRACGMKVFEAASGEEAKAILQAGIEIHVLLSDAQLAGPESGFALAQWIRRHRPAIEVILTSSVASKAEAASEFCSRSPDTKAPSDAAGLTAKIQALAAERKRRARPPSSAQSSPARRRRR